MAVNPSPWGPKPQFFLPTGLPAVGYKLFAYVAGTVGTKQDTFTTSSGAVANTNPIVLDANGYVPNGIWFTEGQLYKLVLAPSTDTDPPTSPVWTVDNLRGQNDTTVTIDQWVASGLTPTFVSATQFTLPGDQTSTFQVGRRLKTTNSGGTVYSTISASVFGALTTVTVVNDSGVLDAGLSSVSYGLLSSVNNSVPAIPVTRFTQSTNRVLGRTTAGTGQIEELTGAQVTALLSASTSSAVGVSLLQLGAISGLQMSTAGSSGTMAIAAGMATAGDGSAQLSLTASINKTTSSWAVGTGNGGLDTGVIANNTWYHFYVIRRPDTGVVDVLFSTSATTPTLPANYTQSRRIGAGRTNSSAQWVRFFQTGDQFLWDNLGSLDLNATSTTTATLVTLTVPTGVKVESLMNVYDINSSAGSAWYISDPDVTDVAASSSAWPLGSSGAPVNASAGRNQVRCTTNTSAQIRSRHERNDSTLRIATIGWIDRRGKN